MRFLLESLDETGLLIAILMGSIVPGDAVTADPVPGDSVRRRADQGGHALARGEGKNEESP